MIERTLFSADHQPFRDAFRRFCEGVAGDGAGREIAPVMR